MNKGGGEGVEERDEGGEDGAGDAERFFVDPKLMCARTGASSRRRDTSD